MFINLTSITNLQFHVFKSDLSYTERRRKKERESEREKKWGSPRAFREPENMENKVEDTERKAVPVLMF